VGFGVGCFQHVLGGDVVYVFFCLLSIDPVPVVVCGIGVVMVITVCGGLSSLPSNPPEKCFQDWCTCSVHQLKLCIGNAFVVCAAGPHLNCVYPLC